jgi:hypothetical protein
VLSFPDADATWVYDVATGMWHEWAWWDKSNAAYHAHRGICHAYGYGKHLVGDRENGKIYELSPTVYTDVGDPIRRLRSSPHVANSTRIITYNEFVLDMETGMGLQAGQGSYPKVMLQASNNGGKTWGSERWETAGAVGQYKRRVHWHRLGSSRDRCFRIIFTDPIPVCLVNAHLDITPGRD